MKPLRTLFLSLITATGAAVNLEAGPYFLDAVMTPKDGLAHCGDTVTLSARLLKDKQPAVGEKLRWFIKWEGKVVKEETVETTEQAITLSYKGEQPGWVYFGFQVIGPDGKALVNPGTQIKQKIKKQLLFEIGAMFDPEKITARPSRPADFEAYWTAERNRLQQLPFDVALKPLPEAYRADKVDSFAISINCLGRHPVTGYFSVPKNAKPGSCPILVDYLSMVNDDASPTIPARAAADFNAIALYVSWHGLATGHKPEWYAQQRKIDLGDGGVSLLAEREQWYFHDMYLRVLRALDFMKTRPEWNGKDLIIRGGSLGGIQSIVAAALEPAASLVLINVPTGCEFTGLDSGRQPPWTMSGRDLKKLQEPAVKNTLAYHDAVNFAPMFHCPTFVCTGFVDETCFPSSVYAFFNALPASIRKTMTTYPDTGHYGTTVNKAGDAYLREQGKKVQFPN